MRISLSRISCANTIQLPANPIDPMTSFQTILKKLWPEKIRAQLIIGIALIHLALMSIFVIDTVNRQGTFLKNQNHDHAFSFLNDYAVNANSYIIANDYNGLERLTISR